MHSCVLAVPGPPSAALVSVISATSCTVNYETPEIQDGGPPVSGFLLQFRASGRPWSSVNERPVIGTEVKVNRLQPGIDYEFRVIAVNDNGCGEYGSASDPIKVQQSPSTQKRMGHREHFDVTSSDHWVSLNNIHKFK